MQLFFPPSPLNPNIESVSILSGSEVQVLFFALTLPTPSFIFVDFHINHVTRLICVRF